jgi:hypothetical protein
VTHAARPNDANPHQKARDPVRRLRIKQKSPTCKAILISNRPVNRDGSDDGDQN